jgi:hypothetical protein
LGVGRGANNSPYETAYYETLHRASGLRLFLFWNDQGNGNARMGDTRNAYRILVRKPESKRLLRRLRCRREKNIGTDLKEIGFI